MRVSADKKLQNLAAFCEQWKRFLRVKSRSNKFYAREIFISTKPLSTVIPTCENNASFVETFPFNIGVLSDIINFHLITFSLAALSHRVDLQLIENLTLSRYCFAIKIQQNMCQQKRWL